MAVRLVLAIAAEREIDLVRQRGDQVERVAVVGRSHLGAVLAEKFRPVLRRLRRVRELHRLRLRPEIGIPHVEPVLRGIFGFRHAARRPPHRADARAFMRQPRAAEPDDADGHLRLPRVALRQD